MSRGLADFASAIKPLPQQAVAAASITGSYALVGALFGSDVVLLVLTSTLDHPVQVSFDGVNASVPVINGGQVILPFRSCMGAMQGQYGVYVKTLGTGPTSGSLYVSAFTL